MIKGKERKGGERELETDGTDRWSHQRLAEADGNTTVHLFQKLLCDGTAVIAESVSRCGMKGQHGLGHQLSLSLYFSVVSLSVCQSVIMSSCTNENKSRTGSDLSPEVAGQ